MDEDSIEETLEKTEKKFGRPFVGNVKHKTGEEKYACYRKSVLRSLGKLIKNLDKNKALKESIKNDLKLMNDKEQKAVREIMTMFKNIKCKMQPGTELVWKALYAWNREVKETFFENFACAYLFIKAKQDILKMQRSKSMISKDNSGKKSKGIKKDKSASQKKEDLSADDKYKIYQDIISEYEVLAFEMSLNRKNFTFLNK